MPDLYTRDAMLERMHASRAALDAALARFDSGQMVRARPPDGWSVQDVMAHLTFWEQYALDRLREAAGGESPRLLGNVTAEQVDDINHEALDAGRARPLADVRADFARVYGELRAAVEALPDEAAGDPFWALWPDAETVWLLVQYNTFDHYDEHLAQVQTWLDAEA